MPATWDEKPDTIDVAEVHWSTGTILAVFFAAALISACFFGLGYSFGRGGTANSAGTAAFSSANTPARAPAPERSQQDHNSVATIIGAQRTAAYPEVTQPSANRSGRPVVHSVNAPNLSPINAHAAPLSSHPGTAHYMVQVGAVGNRRDARTLVLKLRRRGFHAGIYEGKHDRFLHVQIGPFATIEEAQTVRHHVAASGYRAILKHSS